MQRCLIHCTRLIRLTKWHCPTSQPWNLPSWKRPLPPLQVRWSTILADSQQDGKVLHQSRELQNGEERQQDDSGSDAVSHASYNSGDEALDFLLAGYAAQSVKKTPGFKRAPRSMQIDGERWRLHRVGRRTSRLPTGTPQAKILVTVGVEGTQAEAGLDTHSTDLRATAPPGELSPLLQRTAGKLDISREQTAGKPALRRMGSGWRWRRFTGIQFKHLLIGKSTVSRKLDWREQRFSGVYTKHLSVDKRAPIRRLDWLGRKLNGVEPNDLLIGKSTVSRKLDSREQRLSGVHTKHLSNDKRAPIRRLDWQGRRLNGVHTKHILIGKKTRTRKTRWRRLGTIGAVSKHLILGGDTKNRKRRVSLLSRKQLEQRRRQIEQTAMKRRLRLLSKPAMHIGGWNALWNINFAKVRRIYDKRHSETYLKEIEPPVLDKRVKTWTEKVELQLSSSDGTLSMDALASECGIHHLMLWLQVTLWLLLNQPANVVRFLIATHRDPYPPAGWVVDSLQHLALHYTHLTDASTGQHFHDLCDAFCLLAQRNTSDKLSFRGSFFRLLIPHCSDQQIQELYMAIKSNGVAITDNTFLHFANHFARNKHFRHGLYALLEAHRVGADLRGVAFRSNCATLLRKAMEQPGGMRTCLDIVDILVKIGLVLNTQLCNIIMLNAVEAGDVKTAWSVFHSLRESGVEADANTYAVLLKGCKDSIDDADLLNSTIRAAIDGMNVLQNAVVATEILHCLALHHLQHRPDTAWITVCEAYAQMFDLGPLQQLGLPLSNSPDSPLPANPPMAPAPHTVSIMLRLYVQTVRDSEASRTQTYDIYKRYRAALASHEQPFATLATTDYIPNAFLMAFANHKSTLFQAAEVISDMQKPAANVPQIPPTQQAWNIFLLGFVKHNQMKLAEQVMTYMRGKGMEPSQVTHNTLVQGYARVQDVEGTTAALERLGRTGHVWDSWTYGGLKRLRDRRRLREVLEEHRWEKGMNFTGELRKGIKERIAGVEGVDWKGLEAESEGVAHDKDGYPEAGESVK